MTTLQEQVNDLKPGDEVRGVFKELKRAHDDWSSEPTGGVYEATGVVYSYPSLTPDVNGLAIRTAAGAPGNAQCLLDTGGNPGHWLVSLEVLKKGN